MRDLVIGYISVLGVLVAMAMLLGFIAWHLFVLGTMERRRYREAYRAGSSPRLQSQIEATEPAMPNVSSKWYVTAVEGQKVSLSPVCRGIENREWASATPAGSMAMWISNPAALAAFTLGEEYEAIFRHVPKPKPGDGHAVDALEIPNGDRVYYVCGKCGSYARLNDDGSPNWQAHEELFGVSS